MTSEIPLCKPDVQNEDTKSVGTQVCEVNFREDVAAGQFCLKAWKSTDGQRFFYTSQVQEDVLPIGGNSDRLVYAVFHIYSTDYPYTVFSCREGIFYKFRAEMSGKSFFLELVTENTKEAMRF